MKATTQKTATCIAIALAAFAVQSTKADITQFDLGTGNSALAGYSGPYAEVTIDLTSSTTATITFQSIDNGTYTYNLGDGGTVGVNVNASLWTLGTITGSNSGTGYTPGPYSDGGAGNEDGFGSFNQTINSFDGNMHSSTTVSFTLTDDSGTWANASDVLSANASGNYAAAHIFVAPDPANAANNNPATGYATSSSESTNSVPDGGSTAIMLGCALVGLSRGRRWFARK